MLSFACATVIAQLNTTRSATSFLKKHLREAETVLRDFVLEATSQNRPDYTPSQRELSGIIDEAIRHKLRVDHAHDALFLAHMALCCVPGAGAWFTALAIDDGRHMSSPLFQISLKRRLRMPVMESEAPCPCCGQTLDVWGDHAVVCMCNGDRTVKHNAMRNIVFEKNTSSWPHTHS